MSLCPGSSRKRHIAGWRAAHPEEMPGVRRRLVVHLPVLHPGACCEVGCRAAAFHLLRPQTARGCEGRLVSTANSVTVPELGKKSGTEVNSKVNREAEPRDDGFSAENEQKGGKANRPLAASPRAASSR